MKLLQSYFRHFFTLKITMILVWFGLPEEGLSDVAMTIAEAVVLVAVWGAAKYLLPLLKDQSLREALKNLGGGAANAWLIGFGFALVALPLALTSCAGTYTYRGDGGSQAVLNIPAHSSK